MYVEISLVLSLCFSSPIEHCFFAIPMHIPNNATAMIIQDWKVMPTIILNEKVDLRLNEGFKKTNETFQGILERISKIDEAQKKIEQLSTNIISLQDILSDKKSRGCYGEVQLHTILASVFGDKNDKVYQLQYQLPNSTMVDSILRCPQPLGMVAIDSKFPLENYQRMMDRTISDAEREVYIKAFKADVKKHIDDIFKYANKTELFTNNVYAYTTSGIIIELAKRK